MRTARGSRNVPVLRAVNVASYKLTSQSHSIVLGCLHNDSTMVLSLSAPRFGHVWMGFEGRDRTLK